MNEPNWPPVYQKRDGGASYPDMSDDLDIDPADDLAFAPLPDDQEEEQRDPRCAS